MIEQLPNLPDLPPVMRERAIWAREQILEHPEMAEIDEDELLAWMYHAEDKVWYSIAGNYSYSSPQEKMEKRRERLKQEEQRERLADEKYVDFIAEQRYYSEVRQRILERDDWTCQNCGQRMDKLHVHHIAKRDEGRVDADDNLVSLCHYCHRLLDGKEYGLYKETSDLQQSRHSQPNEKA
jgi:5-methylcytosine-specific restriction endonuclease McrA